MPTEEFYFENIRPELHPFYTAHTFCGKCLLFFVDPTGRQFLWYLHDGIGYFVVSKCVTTSFSRGQRWFFDVVENFPLMEDVMDVMKDCIEGSLKELVGRTNIEIHVQEGSKSRILSWTNDAEYGRIWSSLNYRVSSTPITVSLDLLNRVSSPPSPLTPTRSWSQQTRPGAEVSSKKKMFSCLFNLITLSFLAGPWAVVLWL